MVTGHWCPSYKGRMEKQEMDADAESGSGHGKCKIWGSTAKNDTN